MRERVSLARVSQQIACPLLACRRGRTRWRIASDLQWLGGLRLQYHVSMPDYRRACVPGGSSFFTVVTDNRARLYATARGRNLLGSMLRRGNLKWPSRLTPSCCFPPAADAEFAGRNLPETFASALRQAQPDLQLGQA